MNIIPCDAWDVVTPEEQDGEQKKYVDIINEALTAERAEAAVVRERHDRMAALITEWSKTQVSSKRLTEAVKRYEEKK